MATAASDGEKELDWFIRKRLRAHADAASYVEDENVDDILQLIRSERAQAAEEAIEKVLDWGSWLQDKCDLHEKYTSRCCGCQKASYVLQTVGQYQYWISNLAPAKPEQKGKL